MYLFSFARLTTSSSLSPGLTLGVIHPRSLRYSSRPNSCSSRRTVGLCILSALSLLDARSPKKPCQWIRSLEYGPRYFLKYLRHFLHWKRFSEMFFSGTLQNGHVSRTARMPSDPSNTRTLRGRNPFPILACCLLEYAR